MKGIFGNCNGFGDPKKYRFLSEITKEKNLDFIALSETGRDNIPQSTLNNICARKDFLWHIKPPKGRSGGMVVGVNLLMYDIGEIEEAEFLVCFKLRNREDDFKWNLVLVYGPAQQEHKERFLTEVVQMCSKQTLPIILGGDFNIIRGPWEKKMTTIITDGPFFSMQLLTPLTFVKSN
jgi:exonuclease III